MNAAAKTAALGAALFATGIVSAASSVVYFFGPCPTFSASCSVDWALRPGAGTCLGALLAVAGLLALTAASSASGSHPVEPRSKNA